MKTAEIALQTLLLLAFLSFTIASFSLITVVYTVVPFSTYGVLLEIQVNIGIVCALFALATLTVFFWRRSKK